MTISTTHATGASYPISAGHRGDSASQAGAQSVDRDPERKITTYVLAVIAAILEPDLCSDEISALTGEVLRYAQPRIAELVRLDVLTKTGRHKPNPSSGRRATILLPSHDLLEKLVDLDDLDALTRTVRAFIVSRCEAERNALFTAKRGAH